MEKNLPLLKTLYELEQYAHKYIPLKLKTLASFNTIIDGSIVKLYSCNDK